MYSFTYRHICAHRTVCTRKRQFILTNKFQGAIWCLELTSAVSWKLVWPQWLRLPIWSQKIEHTIRSEKKKISLAWCSKCMWPLGGAVISLFPHTSFCAENNCHQSTKKKKKRHFNNESKIYSDANVLGAKHKELKCATVINKANTGNK